MTCHIMLTSMSIVNITKTICWPVYIAGKNVTRTGI